MPLYKTIRDAASAWVDTFSHIPQGICRKLLEANCEELIEVTPPVAGRQVFICDGEFDGCEGVIVGRMEDPDSGETGYSIRLDEGGTCVVKESGFEIRYNDVLPMWGVLWAFSERVDNDWLTERGGIQMMADCGFRIYEQEDYQYIFGIDGAGYSFLDEHFVPLYKARGLQWHESN